MQISANDAFQLAQAFTEASKLISDILFNKGLPMSDDWEKLKSTNMVLLAAAGNLVTHAVGVTLQDGKADLVQIKDATQKAKHVLQVITDIKKAIAIAGALLDLATAIPTGNVVSIATSAAGLFKAVGVPAPF
jgi:hypothetical protein